MGQSKANNPPIQGWEWIFLQLAPNNFTKHVLQNKSKMF
jgi:hypothetical protein